MSLEQLVAHVRENEMNVTLSGGDPLYQMPQMLDLCKALKAIDKTIWCYTGFTYEQVAADPSLSPILDAIDVLVEGPFIEALRDIGLRFRGSSNQRIIDCALSRAAGSPILWTENF